MKRRNRIKYGVGFLVLGAAMITLMGFATMYLWNWLIPSIFNGGMITFWQAIGLLALGKLLTGFMGWGRHNWGRHYGWHGRHGMDSGYWRKRWDEKLEKMSPEEREKFKSYYYDRCGYKYGWMKDEKNQEAETTTGGA